MPSRPVPWLSLIVAPFASVPAVALSGLGSSDAGAGWDFVYGLLFGFTIGVPFALAGLVFVGLPLYYLPRRWPLFRWWTACAAGPAAALFMMHDAPFRTVLMAMVSGLGVGLSAYLLAPANDAVPSGRHSEADPSLPSSGNS